MEQSNVILGIIQAAEPKDDGTGKEPKRKNRNSVVPNLSTIIWEEKEYLPVNETEEETEKQPVSKKNRRTDEQRRGIVEWQKYIAVSPEKYKENKETNKRSEKWKRKIVRAIHGGGWSKPQAILARDKVESEYSFWDA